MQTLGIVLLCLAALGFVGALRLLPARGGRDRRATEDDGAAIAGTIANVVVTPVAHDHIHTK